MRTPRVYHDRELQSGETVSLDTAAANHIARVLRLRTGSALTLFNGRGGEYAATLTSLSKWEVVVEVGPFRDRDVESPLEIILVQGISRGERMDYTVQKAVELGVTRIIPVITERTAVKLDSSRWEKKLRHWQGVIISACEQCGRNRLPELSPIMPLHEYLEHCGSGLKLLLDPRATTGISNLAVQSDVTLLIGPEGGLSHKEQEAAAQARFKGIRFGPRILRTETAAIAAVSILQSMAGDIG